LIHLEYKKVEEVQTLKLPHHPLDLELIEDIDFKTYDEAFQKGREFTVPILEKKGIPKALPVIEIRTKRTFFDYEAKYEGASEEICPAPIPEEVRTQAQNLALDAHAVLGCKGYSRTDIIWQDSGLFVLETNTLPGLTKMSLFPQSAKVAGITFAELLDQILQEGLRA